MPHRKKKSSRGKKAGQSKELEINLQTNQLDDTIGHNWELPADLQEEEEEVKKITHDIKIQEYDIQQVKQGDEQGAAPQQILLQIGNQENVLKEKMEDKAGWLHEQIDIKRKELNRAYKRASHHSDTVCQLDQVQSAVESTRAQCYALEEALRCRLTVRDERHRQELSQREAAHRKELSEQEARFRKERAELIGGFEQRLVDLKGKMERQLSEEEESCKKQERLSKIFAGTEEEVKRWLSEQKGSLQTEPSDWLAQLPANQESEAQRSEENLELVMQVPNSSTSEEKPQKKRSFWEYLVLWCKTPVESEDSPSSNKNDKSYQTTF